VGVAVAAAAWLGVDRAPRAAAIIDSPRAGAGAGGRWAVRVASVRSTLAGGPQVDELGGGVGE
jgi:hypothetical protein